MTKERVNVTAITVVAGLITLIEPDGRVQVYRQRGIKRIPEGDRNILIANGLLDRTWSNYKELPSNYSVSFEDEILLGKCRATYPYEKLKNQFRKAQR